VTEEKKHHSEASEPQHPKKPLIQRIKHFYETEYKKLLIIPLLLVLLAFGQIGFQIATTGDFLIRDVSLRGGISVILPEKTMDLDPLREFLSQAHPEADFELRTLTGAKGLVVDAADLDFDALKPTLEEQFGPLEAGVDYSVSTIGSSLGASFFKETFTAMILAFIFMGIVVLITFRVLAPSLAVIAAAASDIIVTLAIVNMLGISMSTAGIAAFLMLIGYSVDTDILLSTKVLKQKKGKVMDRVYSSMKTGMTMTITTLGAVSVALFVATSDTIIQIMTILIIGLLVDIIMTYIQNVAILRIYLERKNPHEKHT